MKKILLNFVLGISLVFACIKTVGTLQISNAHFKALKGSPNGSAYMNITETGDGSDKLIGASCEISERVEIHDHITDPSTNAKKMVEIKSIHIPSKKENCWFLTCWFAKPKPVEFVMGGKHLMLMGLKPGASDLKAVDIKLIFEKAGETVVKFKAFGADSSANKTTCEHHK